MAVLSSRRSLPESYGSASEATTVERMHRRYGHRIASGSLAVVFGLGLAQAATAVQLALAARSAAIAAYGAFITMYSVAVSIGTMINFGAQAGLTRDLSRGSRDAHLEGALYSRSIASLVVALPFTVVMIMINRGALPVLSVVLLSAQVCFIPISLDVLGVVRGLRAPAVAVWCTTAGNLLGVLIYVLAFRGHGLTGAATGLSVSWLASIGLGVVAVRSYWSRASPVAWKDAWFGMGAFGVATVANAADQVSVPIVNWVAGSAEAGLAGSVSRWTAPVQLLMNAQAFQLFPELAAADSDRTAMKILKHKWVAPLISVLLSGALMVTAPWIVETTLGPRYEAGGRILQLLSLASAVSALGRQAVVFLQARGHERFLAKASVAIRAVSAVVLTLLASRFGGIAIGLTAVGTSTVLAVVTWAKVAFNARDQT